MFWLVFGLIVIILLFSIVVFMGPPYLPTRHKQVQAALDLLDMQPGETLLDVGSGDGRVLLAALERGYKAIGIELNPLLVLVSIIVTWKYRSQVRIVWGSFWGLPWPRADAIFTFMLPKYMSKFGARVEAWHTKPVAVASYAFKIPDKESKEERHGVYLYHYN